MNSLPNTEFNPKIHFSEITKSGSCSDTINPFVGQYIDVNSYNISYAINFESEPVNEWSYHFDQEYTSTDI
ncbi:MAG: hypothetical protein V7K50_10260 [Nostoc sp.]|uniref:hypothetical protein n=1 Tax=Nostoc sp. TaxID=1180 RepID=UPI002FFA60AF